MREFYKILGISTNATSEEIKEAWRKLVKRYHPDKGGTADGFRKINHAYKMLTDASYRHENDSGKNKIKDVLNISVRIPVSFYDAFFGKKFTMTYNRLEVDDMSNPVFKDSLELISICVNLPPGSMSGYQHTEYGAGSRSGKDVGDCVINFMPASNPRYTIKGDDVYSEEKVPLDIMLKGGKIEVLTLYGLRTAIVSPGSQPGMAIKIKKCGVSQKGAHFAVISPKFPSTEQLKQEDTWKDLNIDWSFGFSTSEEDES